MDDSIDNLVKYKIHFYISGDSFDTKKLTEILNIDPFKVRQKGDNIGSHTFYKEISWEYIFESCDWHLDDGTSFILEVFADKINKFKKDNNLHCSISVEYYITRFNYSSFISRAKNLKVFGRFELCYRI